MSRQIRQSPAFDTVPLSGQIYPLTLAGFKVIRIDAKQCILEGSVAAPDKKQLAVLPVTTSAAALAVASSPYTIRVEIDVASFPRVPPVIRIAVPAGYRVRSSCKCVTANGIGMPDYIRTWNVECTLAELHVCMISEFAADPPIFEPIPAATAVVSAAAVTGGGPGAAAAAAAAASSSSSYQMSDTKAPKNENTTGGGRAAAEAASKAITVAPLVAAALKNPLLTLRTEKEYDVRDGFGKWVNGEIITFYDASKAREVDADSPYRAYAYVHFPGFGEQYDELIPCPHLPTLEPERSTAIIESRFRRAGLMRQYLPGSNDRTFQIGEVVLALPPRSATDGRDPQWIDGVIGLIDMAQYRIGRMFWVHAGAGEIVPLTKSAAVHVPALSSSAAASVATAPSNRTPAPIASSASTAIFDAINAVLAHANDNKDQTVNTTTDTAANTTTSSEARKSRAELEREEKEQFEKAIADSKAEYEKWKSTETQDVITIPAQFAGQIIGVEEVNILKVAKETQTQILVPPPEKDQTEVKLMVLGTPDRIAAATATVEKHVQRLHQAFAAAVVAGAGRGRGERGRGRGRGGFRGARGGGGGVVPADAAGGGRGNAAIASGGAPSRAQPQPIAAASDLKSRERSGSGGIVPRAHVFIDWSNISLGAQCTGQRDSDRDFLLRVDPSVLTAVLENRQAPREPMTRVVAGSTPGATAPLWNIFEIQLSYKVKWQDRGVRREDNKRGETYVDELLHNEMGNALLEYEPSASEPQVMVLATGDGNQNHGSSTSFPKLIVKALKRGWHVEVWSWKDSTSNVYRQLSRDVDYGGRMTLHFLDDRRQQLVYREGNHRVFVSPTRHNAVHAANSAGAANQLIPSVVSASAAASSYRDAQSAEPRSLAATHRHARDVAARLNAAGGASVDSKQIVVSASAVLAASSVVSSSSAAVAVAPAQRSEGKHAGSSAAAAADSASELCVMCQDRQSDTSFQPCGHVCVCARCSEDVKPGTGSCFVCSSSFTGFERAM